MGDSVFVSVVARSPAANVRPAAARTCRRVVRTVVACDIAPSLGPPAVHSLPIGAAPAESVVESDRMILAQRQHSAKEFELSSHTIGHRCKSRARLAPGARRESDDDLGCEERKTQLAHSASADPFGVCQSRRVIRAGRSPQSGASAAPRAPRPVCCPAVARQNSPACAAPSPPVCGL
jgi:hypothetical protein